MPKWRGKVLLERKVESLGDLQDLGIVPEFPSPAEVGNFNRLNLINDSISLNLI